MDRTGRLHGQLDSPLRGHQEAGLAARALAGRHFDTLPPSPLGHARATAAIIGKAIGMQPVPFEDLREMDFGWMEGGQLFNFAKDPPLVRRLRSAWISTVVRLSGEPRSRFGERVANAGREIARLHPDHMCWQLSTWLCAATCWPACWMVIPAWVRYDAWPAGAFTEIEIAADGKARLIDLNVNAHLNQPRSSS
jgi:broad specificity phosphatase PhoE